MHEACSSDFLTMRHLLVILPHNTCGYFKKKDLCDSLSDV